MIPDRWRTGEVAVVGLGRSGQSATRLLVQERIAVYASDGSSGPAIETAAHMLAEAGATVETGRHDLQRVAQAAAVVVSPGVPPNAPVLKAARAANVEILSELDLGLQRLDGVTYVAVTGTNGKTTTTALTAHLLVTGGRQAIAVGNIGTPVTAIAPADAPEWLVVEASSFQLHDAPHLDPTIGVLTNLDTDHLDRYDSVDDYYADKRLLFQHARDTSRWVLNGDDAAVGRLARGVLGRRYQWSLAGVADAWFDRERQRLMLGDAVVLDRGKLQLLGDHNVANALAGTLAASVAGVSIGAIAKGLESFRALPHRLEPVGEQRGVLWINDSKATNVSSTVVALQAMTRRFVLLVGGVGKGQSFVPMRDWLHACRAVVAYGEAASQIVAELSSRTQIEQVVTLEDASQRARSLAHEGDVVLLSPACASFDQFDNYEARGEHFRTLAQAP